MLVAEPNQPGRVWPLGAIVSTHPGQDGMVRAVAVRTQYGENKRPIAKLRLVDEAEVYNCKSSRHDVLTGGGGGGGLPLPVFFIVAR